MKRLWSRREKQRTSTKPSELVWMLISHISSHKSELRRAKRRGEKSGKEKGNSELLYGSKYILQYNTFKNPETKITKEHFQKVKIFFFVWSHSSQSRVALFSAEIPRPRTNPMPRRVPIYSQIPVEQSRPVADDEVEKNWEKCVIH